MIKHEVKTSKELKELYDGSALTVEGIDTSDESLNGYIEWLNENTGCFKGEPEFWIISGETMNCEYNPRKYYPDNLQIVCVKLDTFLDIGKLVLSRFNIGARWFDDVVDNIRCRG